MAFLAASFAIGVTLLIAVVPLPLAVFTSAVVVAFSIAVFAAVAFSVALSFPAFSQLLINLGDLQLLKFCLLNLGQ